MVRPEVELIVNASAIPSELEVDLNEFELGDTINISNISTVLMETAIQGRFAIAIIQSPSGLKSAEDEADEAKEMAKMQRKIAMKMWRRRLTDSRPTEVQINEVNCRVR